MSKPDTMTRETKLVRALSQALKECRLHNEEYHHRTPPELIEQWRRILLEGGPYEDD